MLPALPDWNTTLDMCYGSVKVAYKSLALPPLGSADHNCVFLLPIYKTVLRREKVKESQMAANKLGLGLVQY